ncbi:MAG: Gx transporter family protein [Gallionella sp.]|nr:Gx transporter family protein [Gallionella sp.]
MTASIIKKSNAPLPSRERGGGEGEKVPTLLKLKTTAGDHHIARMAAVALGLTLIENAIPTPLPGVKPGLANIVTLIVLARYGWRVAAWVSLLRVVAGSLLFGSFLTPGFFLSLAGAVCSLVVLAFAQHLPTRWFGAVSHSIYAAFAHITGQMLVVYLWLIPHAGIAYLIPIFATAALVFGTVNGLIATRFMHNADMSDIHTIEKQIESQT